MVRANAIEAAKVGDRAYESEKAEQMDELGRYEQAVQL